MFQIQDTSNQAENEALQNAEAEAMKAGEEANKDSKAKAKNEDEDTNEEEKDTNEKGSTDKDDSAPTFGSKRR